MEKYSLLFESIFKKKLADSDAVDYLENLTKEHPYFSVAQFFLLRLSQKNVNGYRDQARKTAVLFNNNHWLNFQLLEAGFDGREPADAIVEAQSFPEKIADAIETNENAEEKNIEIPAETIITETPVEQVIEEEKNIIVEEEQQLAEEIQAEESGPIEPVVANEEVKAFEEMPVAEALQEATPQVEEKNEVAVEGVDLLEKEIEPEESPAEDIKTFDETTAAEEIKAVEEPLVPETLSEAKEPTEEKDETGVAGENTPAASTGTKPAPEPLLFEPLHTTDYFASVGIKLSEEEKTAGSLGRQLKSFTEWLKTMKKVHTEQLVQTSNPVDVNLSASESNIQKLAERSNQENDVITEAMADVLIQQGKEDKALEILEKLSLLNPSKSVYFAAKINQIKEK